MTNFHEHPNPFPGLRPFKTDEDYLFFGREGQSDELLRRLRRTRFLAVVGTSGSGKSSLVRAGLIPAVRGGFMTQAGSNWRIAAFQPGGDPISELARALNLPAVFGNKWGDDEDKAAIQASFTEITLRRSDLGLVEVVRHARLPANENLLVIVDQFEELFRFKSHYPGEQASDESAAFVKLLLSAAKTESVPIYIVLTMRSDFLGDCAQFRDLPEAINDGQYLIPRMTRDQRRQAIQGPTAVGGATITPRLVQRLLNDVGDDPDQLPILQHALMRTWDIWQAAHADSEPLDLPHYEATGGMTQALSRHADEIYYGLPSDRSREIAKELFKCLTYGESGDRGIRRPTRLAEIAAVTKASEDEVITIIEAFRQPGCSFLMPPVEVPLKADTVIDISHESLMRVWTRLKKWVEQEAQSAAMYRRLADRTVRYQNQQAGLWRDPELQLALNWLETEQPNHAWATRYYPGYEAALNFLEESRLARETERAEIAARQQRELEQAKALAAERAAAARRYRAAAILLAIVFLLVLIVGWLAWIAQSQAKLVAAAKVESLKGLSQRLATNAQAALEAHPQRSLLLAVEALEVINPAGLRLPAVEQALRDALLKTDGFPLSGHDGPIMSAVFSPDGQTLVTASFDKTARLWNVTDPAAPHLLYTLSGHEAPILAAAFSPHGQWLVTAGADKSARLWDMSDPTAAPIILSGHQAAILALAFSPDGRWLVTASEDKTTRLWTMNDPTAPPVTLVGHEAPIWTVAFSPGGDWLVTAGDDNTVRLWHMFDPATPPITLVGHEAPIRAAAFSPDGQTLVTAGEDAVARVWNITNLAAPPLILSGHRATIRAIAFSPDGRRLVTGANDETARIWDLSNPTAAPIILSGHQAAILALAFSPDGQWLVTASEDKTARLWTMNDPTAPPVTLVGHEATILAVAFSPDGQTLVTAGLDNMARLWKVTNPKAYPPILFGHKAPISAAAFSPDGRTLVTAGDDNTARLWNLSNPTNPAPLSILTGHEAPLRTAAFSPDGQFLVTAGNDKTARLWDVSRPAAAKLLATFSGHESPIRTALFSPDSQTLVTAGDDTVARLWNVTDLTSLPVILTGHTASIWAVAFSPDGQTLVTASSDKTVRLWNMREPTAAPVILAGHSAPIRTAAFSPDGQTLVTAGDDNTARLWDMTDLSAPPVTLVGHEAAIRVVAFSPDGQWLVTAGEDATARLWDLADPTSPPLILVDHTATIRAVAFSPDGQTLVTAGNDNTARLWNMTNLNAPPVTLTGHEAAIRAVAFSPDGQVLVTASNDTTARLWELSLDKLREAVCRTVGRNLSADEWRQFFQAQTYHQTCPDLPPSPGVTP